MASKNRRQRKKEERNDAHAMMPGKAAPPRGTPVAGTGRPKGPAAGLKKIKRKKK